MGEAMAALLGAVVGSAGTAGAALLTGWSTRWQVRTQGQMQHEQWRRQVRRDAYSSLVTAAAQAHEELSVVWRLLRASQPDHQAADARMHQAHTLVHAMQRAGATVAVEGPEEIFDAARAVEDSITLLYAGLGALQQQMRNSQALDEHRQLCRQQRVRVRDSIDAFAATARGILDDPARPLAGGR